MNLVCSLFGKGHQEAETRGWEETSQTALTSKGLATALQTRPQQVGTARSPLKMDFNPGHGEPGSQRVGVKPQRGSTAVALPAPCSCLSCWPG